MGVSQAASPFVTLDEMDVSGKRVLLRGDLNVPVDKGAVTDATRVTRLAKTVRELVEKKAKVIVLSHFSRPKNGPDPSMSLKPVADKLSSILSMKVAFAEDCVGPKAESAVAAMQPGEVLVLENTRFHKGEEANDPAFVKQLAALGDMYVNDAFSVSHRAHASTEGLAHVLPAAAGRDMEEELQALARALDHPEKPLMAIVGGSKVSTKLGVLKFLTAKVDAIVLGGAMANTFLAASGKKVGKSMHEPDMLDTAREIMKASDTNGCRIILPDEVVVAEKCAPGEATQVVSTNAIPENSMVLDMSPKSVEVVLKALEGMKTVVWNGPLGVFEVPPFEKGTRAVAQAVAQRTKAGKLLSVAGGGDTVAVLNMAGATRDFSYVSIAGGAFLEWLEGCALPGVEALRRAPSKSKAVVH
jgi:phosphoglycerate kinase